MLLSSVAIWLSWWMGWIIVGLFSKQNATREPLRDRLRHNLPLCGGVCLVFATLVVPPCFSLAVSEDVQWLGLALTVAGLGLACTARCYLGRNWSSLVAVKTGHQLISHGPYRYVRHPIYTGLLIAMAGSVLTAGTLAAIAGWSLVSLAFITKLSQEEQLLRRKLGLRYASLCRRVPARLLPGDAGVFQALNFVQ